MNSVHPLPLLAAEGLGRHYPDGRVTALRDVSLRIERGEYVAIVGPSGSGKSTLLNLLGGLDRPTSGRLFFKGRELSARGADLDAYRAHSLGFVFQSFCLLPTLTALENVQVPMFEGKASARARRAKARTLLAEVGLALRLHHLPGQLSVGERQRVALARALANDPELVLADEPTGNLDTKKTREILDLFGRLRARFGMTLVIVTHSGEVARTADRVIHLRDGRLVADTPAQRRRSA
ncbi:MAG TPA: ABC transporter ATP-binding protein [Gemmatales bacterium]|nr:ABC transporter ATP-binding protein [Gemmatales bacterium]HMP60019.1 ABC transporter ATP-binding protein [Gemmatales bacterium]